MKTKQPVYNGYNEEWLTGSQLKEKFKNHYLTIGRHHADILDISIPDYLEVKQIQENTEYRVFLNSVFCRIMSADTDKELVFFGHHPVSTEESPREIEKICSLCGVPMQWKRGRNGYFLGCSNFPNCKRTVSIKYKGHIK